MATLPNMGGASASPVLVPLDQLLAALPSLPRPLLSRLTARLIDQLDMIDGDPDAEATGDEGEPDFVSLPADATFWGSGPGCPISDPDYGAEEQGEDCQGGEPVDCRPIANPDAYREQIAKRRRERCYRLPDAGKWGRFGPDWRLYYEPTAPTRRQLFRRKRGLPRRPRP